MALVYIDCMPGPSHHYGGLAKGNLASQQNKDHRSSPLAAAKQSMAKWRLTRDLGAIQLVLPPHPRPFLTLAKDLGYDKITDTPNWLLSTIYSSAFMWMANAAHVTGFLDSKDQLSHVTVANKAMATHRMIEADITQVVFQDIFQAVPGYIQHKCLPAALNDEGAANHIHLFGDNGKGVHLFVYGHEAAIREKGERASGRQTKEALVSIVRQHRLSEERFVMAQQQPKVMVKGVFHNDVIATGFGKILFYHVEAFSNQETVLAALERKFKRVTGESLVTFPISSRQLPVEEAVKTYIFNLLPVRQKNKKWALLAPMECQRSPLTKGILAELVQCHEDVAAVHYIECGESMRNGGGPACLTLRFPLAESALRHINKRYIFDREKDAKLAAWVQAHYRKTLRPSELRDPDFEADVKAAYHGYPL